MAAGMAWFRQGGLRWSPTRLWASYGARGFDVRLDHIQRIQLTHVSRRSVGLTVQLSDGAEVWLWLRSKDGHLLFDGLKREANATQN